MFKDGIDQQALIKKFSEASAKQGAAIQQAVNDATLKALQGRELTLANIKQVLETVTKAASTGAAGSSLPAPDVEAMLGKAVAGMDDALEKAVQANRVALQQMVDQGVNVRETHLKSVLSEIEKMEDSFFAAIRKASSEAGAMQGPWASVLSASQGKGTGTGAQAAAAMEQFMGTAQKNLRDSRELGMQASQAMLDSYATLASGVLIGMADALNQGKGKPAAARKK